MEMVGIPKEYLKALLAAALGKVALTPVVRAQAEDHLARLLPVSKKSTLDTPTGTLSTIEIDKTLHHASSIGATPSWTVSRG